MLRFALITLACTAWSADITWPSVPDPAGLGPRLATVAWLHEQGSQVRPGASDEEVLAAYQALRPTGNTIRNKHRLPPVIREDRTTIARLATSAPPRIAAWSGDWAATDEEWTTSPNLARWSIRLIYRAAEGSDRDAGGGAIIVEAPASEFAALDWQLSADGRAFRDDGAVNGMQRWTLRLLLPPLTPINVVATSKISGAKRAWTVRYAVP